jgi:hypothetical protein
MASQYLGGGVLQVISRLYGAVGSLRTSSFSIGNYVYWSAPSRIV